MIDDSFGDDDLWFEDRIRERDRLIQIQVSEQSRDGSIRDDLINEARLTVWKVLCEKPDATGLLSVATKRRIGELVQRGQRWTGMETKHGHPIDPLRRPHETVDDEDHPVVVEAADVLSGVEMAYHEGEILDAIRSLEPRHQAYVILRFWGGYTNPEIAAIQSVGVGNMSRTWTTVIQPALAERLQHLVDVT